MITTLTKSTYRNSQGKKRGLSNGIGTPGHCFFIEQPTQVTLNCDGFMVRGPRDSKALLMSAPLRGHSNDLSLPGLNLDCSCLKKIWGLQPGCLPSFSQEEAGGVTSVRNGLAPSFPQSTQASNSAGRK